MTHSFATATHWGRRNVTDLKRAEVALMMKPIVEAKANHDANAGDKVSEAARQNSVTPLIEKMRTDDTVADMAGVSRDTVRKVEAIRETAAGGGFGAWEAPGAKNAKELLPTVLLNARSDAGDGGIVRHRYCALRRGISPTSGNRSPSSGLSWLLLQRVRLTVAGVSGEANGRLGLHRLVVVAAETG